MVDRLRPDSPLSFHLAGLLSEPPGSTREHQVVGVRLSLDSELQQARPLDGSIRLQRTNRGLMVVAALSTSLATECGRCLTPIEVPLSIRIDEEALPSIDPSSGERMSMLEGAETLHLTDHHELDLEIPIREAISLAEPIAPVCRTDCPGLCASCGEPLAGPPHDHPDEDLDPRFAALQGYVVDGGRETE